MRSFKFALPIFCFSFFILSFHASASSNANADMATLKKIFQDMLDYQKDVSKIYGEEVTLNYDGEITVTQQEGYYAIALPSISISGFEDINQTEKSVLDIGVININAIRGEEAGTWKTMFNLPSSYELKDSSGVDFIIKIGSQTNAGLLVEKLGYFTKLDMKLNDITMFIGEEKLDIAMSNISLLQNLSSTDGIRYSGPTTFSANDFVMSAEEGDTVKLGKIGADVTFNDIVLPSLQDYKAKVLKHQEAFASLADTGNQESIDDQAIMAMFMDLYDFDLDGLSFQYSVNDFSLHNKDTNDHFEFASGVFGIDIEGLMKETGSTGLIFGFQGVQSTDEEPEYKDIMPRNVNLAIRAKNIPVTQLSELASTTMDSISTNPEMAQMAGLGVLMKVPMLLSAAGTTIEISDTFASANAYNTTLSGQAKADMAAITNITADLKSVFAGLDNVLAIAEQYKGAENEYGMYYTQLADTLVKLKSVGVATKTSDGKPAYEFNFKVEPDGKMTINGHDANMLMMQ